MAGIADILATALGGNQPAAPKDPITRTLVSQSPTTNDIYHALMGGYAKPTGASFGEILNAQRAAKIKEAQATYGLELQERQVNQQDKRLTLEDRRTSIAERKAMLDQVKATNAEISKQLDAYDPETQSRIIQAIHDSPTEYNAQDMDALQAKELIHGMAAKMGAKPKDPKLLSPEAEAQQTRLKKAGKPQLTVNVGGGDLAKEVAKTRAKDLGERRQRAVDAVGTLGNNQEALKLLDNGMITGAGAGWRVAFGKALQLAGFNYAKEEIANTEAYFANRAKEVAKVIQDFGAGTGLSDADREYAAKAAAGQIELTETSLRRILDMGDRASRNLIGTYNKEAQELTDEFSELAPLMRPLDMPAELPKYTQSNPARPATQQDYEALPKGSYFIDDEGLKVK